MNRLHMVAVLGSLCLAVSAGAQEVGAPMTQSAIASDSVARPPQPSVIDRPSEAVRRRDTPPPPAPLPATGQHMGESKAEMVVGGAAIVTGALIGGDGGSILMLGGA